MRARPPSFGGGTEYVHPNDALSDTSERAVTTTFSPSPLSRFCSSSSKRSAFHPSKRPESPVTTNLPPLLAHATSASISSSDSMTSPGTSRTSSAGGIFGVSQGRDRRYPYGTWLRRRISSAAATPWLDPSERYTLRVG